MSKIPPVGDGIMDSKSRRSDVSSLCSSMPALALQWQAGRAIIPVLHYSNVPIGAKPLSSAI